MFNKIIIAVDGSEHGHKSARIGGELARQMKSDVWLVTVFDPVPSYLGEPYLHDALAQRIQQSNEIINAAREEIGEIPGKLNTETLEGPPAEAILSVAETRHTDLIVMGSRGLGRLSGMLLGSQSQKVIAHASCPVLIVR